MRQDYAATAIIGAGFGDEGKGITTAYICDMYYSADNSVVVRHSGGAQAGHTVVLTVPPEYLDEDDYEDFDEEKHTYRHVFHHFGSGTLSHVPTMLGRDFVNNPILFSRERRDLQRLFKKIRANYDPNDETDAFIELPTVFADPRGRVTTHVDMLINEMLELKRQKSGEHHGSVGVGINETMVRSESLPLTMIDLQSGYHAGQGFQMDLMDWSRKRMEELGLKPDDDPQRYEWMQSQAIMDAWVADCDALAISTIPTFPAELKRFIIFEGSQGLLLDRNNDRFFPHLTNANTGIANVLDFLNEAKNVHLENIHYVTRTYMTRHGAGPFPSEDSDLRYPDDTNATGTFQGSLRFGRWDEELVSEAIWRDRQRLSGLRYQNSQSVDGKLRTVTPNVGWSVTHKDQVTYKEFDRVVGAMNDAALEGDEAQGLVSSGPNCSNDMAEF